MRKITRFIGVAYVIYLLLPYLIGFAVKYQFERTLEHLSEIDGVNLALIEYDRGYSGSVAITKLEISAKHSLVRSASAKDITSLGGTEILQFTIAHDIKHGPYISSPDVDSWYDNFSIATMYSKIRYGDPNNFDIAKLKELVSVYEEDKNIIGSLDSKLDFKGNLYTNIKTDNINVNLPHNKGFMRWSNVSGEFLIPLHLDGFKGTITVGDFEIYNVNKLKIKNLYAISDTSLNEDGVWIADRNIRVEELYYYDKNTELPVNIIDFNFSEDTEVIRELAYKDFVLNMELLKVGDKIYGPFNSDLQLKKIEPEGIILLQDIFSNAERGLISLVDEETRSAILDALPLVLVSRPAVSFNIDLTAGDQELRADLDMVLGGGKVYDLKLKPKELANSLRGELNFYMPKDILFKIIREIVKRSLIAYAEETNFQYDDESLFNLEVESQTTSIIADLLTSNLIEFEDEVYVSNAVCDKGEVVLNGVKHDAADFFMEELEILEEIASID